MVTRTLLNVRLHLHSLSQNTPMAEDILSVQGSQCTFWTLISSLSITAIRYSIVRGSDNFLLLYSRWSKTSLTLTETEVGFKLFLYLYPFLHSFLTYSLNISDQVSHPYNTKSKISVLCILILKFLDSKLGQKFLHCTITSIPWIQSALNFFLKRILTS